MKSKKPGKSISDIEVLNISAHAIWLFVAGKEYFLPYESYPWFKEKTVSEISNVKLLHRNHIRWPDLDVDLELESLKEPGRYPLVYE